MAALDLRRQMVWNKFPSMARYADKTKVTRQQLAEYAAALHRVAQIVESNVESMEKWGLDSIEITHEKTRIDTAENLFKVCGAIQTALAGAAFEPSQRLDPQAKKSGKQK